MNRIWKISKYLVIDYLKGMSIYYAILFSINLILIASLGVLMSHSSDKLSFGGFGISTIIFMFVTGLNAYKTNLKFMLANNRSRRSFFFANIVAFLGAAVMAAFIDTVMNGILRGMIPYQSVYEQIYRNTSIVSEFCWNFSMGVFAITAGWLITMVYYRCNKLMKAVVSFLPVIVLVLLIKLNAVVKGMIGSAVLKFITVAFGFKDLNSYNAVLSFLLIALCFAGFSYLLNRRMFIRD